MDVRWTRGAVGYDEMARAATKRRQGAKADVRHRSKGSGGQSVEQTLFFSRLRRQAKWVFVFLAVVFAGGFVVFGVGSDIGGGLGDVFSGLGGNGGNGRPSVSKALDATKEHPKSPQAWRRLAEAYELDGQIDPAIGAWTTYTGLRPKDVEGLNRLSGLYQGKLRRQTERAQIAYYEAQAAQASGFTVPATTSLGRALAERPDPVAQAVAADANTRFNQAMAARGDTQLKLVAAYKKIAVLQPREPIAHLQLADEANRAGDPKTAVAAYERFLELAPDDPSASYAKQQIKTLESQLKASSQG